MEARSYYQGQRVDPSPGPVSSTGRSATGSGASTVRLHGLDALRGGALLLGILLHALLPFDASTQWAVADSNPSPLVNPVTTTIHLFRMTLFMALAGYFGSMVLGKRGAASYLRDRAKRILLPAVVFWPVAVLAPGAVIQLNAYVRDLPTPAQGEGAGLAVLLMPGQLWFLWTLMECAIIVVAARAVLNRLVGTDRLARVARLGGSWLSAPGGFLLASVPYALGLVLQGTLGGGIDAPLTIRPEPSLIPYLGAFLTGWLLFARTDSLGRIARKWVPHAGVAILATAACLSPVREALPLPLGATLTALAGWAWVYALLGVCVRHLHRERPALRYVADASYWAYLLHLPLLLLFAIPLADLSWPMLVKLPLTLAATGAVLLISYHLLVRSTCLGRWLNGRSHPFRWPWSSADRT